MATKHILLPLTGAAASADAAMTGLALAKRLGAHATAGYEDRLGPLAIPPGMIDSPAAYGVFYEHMQNLRRERTAVAREHFDKAVAKSMLPIVSAPVCNQGSTMWVDSRGGDETPLSRLGLLTDLVVLDAPGDEIAPIAWNVLEHALFKVHRPVLVVPPGTASVDFSRVLVAWNGSGAVARAMRHVLDLLEPHTKVTVLQIGKLARGRLPAQSAVEYLGWHCVDVELREVPDRPRETSQIILDETRRANAGCIVLGAYTHSRTREMLLGGVTDFMLRHPLMPTLMAH